MSFPRVRRYSIAGVDVTTSLIQKRSIDGDDLLELRLAVGGETVVKRLRRLGDRGDVDMYEFRDDMFVYQEPRAETIRDWAMYGDIAGEAAVVVTQSLHGQRLEGSLHHKGKDFILQPVDGSSAHVLHTVHNAGHMVPIGAVPSERQKRAGDKKQHRVELHMVFDYKLYTAWVAITPPGESTDELIREYYGLLVNEINYRFQTFKRLGLDIGVIMGGLTVCKTNTSTLYNASIIDSEGIGDGDQMLDSFMNWVNKNLRNVDDVMLHTGYYLRGIGGIAWMSGVCTIMNNNVVSDDMNFGSIHTSAHELAHNLGIAHDPDTGPCSRSYNMDPGYTQLPARDYRGNTWKFSACSYRNLEEFIKWLEANSPYYCTCSNNTLDVGPRTQTGNCMLYKNRDVTALNGYGNKMPGADLTFDQQCHRMRKGAYMCRGSQMKHPLENICYYIYCMFPEVEYGCQAMYAYPGTPCGKYKVCQYGKCIDSPRGVDMDDKCPFGERSGGFIGTRNLTCAEAVAESRDICATHSVDCCTSCGGVHVTSGGECTSPDFVGLIDVEGSPMTCAEAIRAGHSSICYDYGKDCCNACADVRQQVNQTFHNEICTNNITSCDMWEKVGFCHIDSYRQYMDTVCFGACHKDFCNGVPKTCEFGDHASPPSTQTGDVPPTICKDVTRDMCDWRHLPYTIPHAP